MFVAISVPLLGRVVFDNWVEDKAYKKVTQMVEDGAVIYLDGNEVDLENIDIFNYKLSVKDGNILLSSK